MSGYIGNIPVPQATQTRDVFTATSGQTSFATSGYTPGFLDVWLNGVKLVNGTDFTATNGSDVVLTSGAAASDIVEVLSYSTFGVNSQTFTGSSTFTGDVLIADKLVHDGDTNTAIRFPAADTVTVETAGTERMCITSSGNLGLGVAPSAWTSFTAMQFGETGCLASNAFSSGNTQTFFGNNVYYDGAYKYIATGSAAAQYIQLGSEHRWNIAPSGTAGNAISFTQAMTLDASGNLLVGTTTAGIQAKSSCSFQDVSATTFTQTINHLGSPGGTAYIEFGYSGVKIGSIVVSTASSVSYNTSSDYRLKENVQPMTGASDRVLALNPVNFAWKADGTRVDGFLAHEAQAVVPEAVHGEKDEVDDEGNPVYQGIDQSKLVPLLTAALQEALQKIEALEARITALEAQP